MVCKRASPKITTQLMGQLPSARVLPTFANDRVSVDYAGPFTLKVGSTRKPTYRKAYVAIFVCLVTEACHIEFQTSLQKHSLLHFVALFLEEENPHRSGAIPLISIRPLISSLDANDDDGISPLTPGHFLIGRPLEALPSHRYTESILGLKRWKLCQALTQHFWKRWSTEYLNGLQRFNKWKRPKRNLQVNDIVLIKDNRTAPCQWPLGRVTKIHPGPDTLVRVVTVQTKTGTFIRPIVKLCNRGKTIKARKRH